MTAPTTTPGLDPAIAALLKRDAAGLVPAVVQAFMKTSGACDLNRFCGTAARKFRSQRWLPNGT